MLLYYHRDIIIINLNIVWMLTRRQFVLQKNINLNKGFRKSIDENKHTAMFSHWCWRFRAPEEKSCLIHLVIPDGMDSRLNMSQLHHDSVASESSESTWNATLCTRTILITTCKACLSLQQTENRSLIPQYRTQDFCTSRWTTATEMHMRALVKLFQN